MGGRGEERKEVDDDAASADCTHHAAPCVRPSARRVGRFCLVSSRFGARELQIRQKHGVISHSFGIIHLLIFFAMYIDVPDSFFPEIIDCCGVVLALIL